MSFAAAGAAATPWLLVASRAHCSVCGAHLASASAWGFPAPAGDASLNMQMSWRTGWMSSYRLIPSGQPAQPAIGCRSSKVCQLQQLCCLLLAARCSLLTAGPACTCIHACCMACAGWGDRTVRLSRGPADGEAHLPWPLSAELSPGGTKVFVDIGCSQGERGMAGRQPFWQAATTAPPPVPLLCACLPGRGAKWLAAQRQAVQRRSGALPLPRWMRRLTPSVNPPPGWLAWAAAGYFSSALFSLWAPELGFRPARIRRLAPEAGCSACDECKRQASAPPGLLLHLHAVLCSQDWQLAAGSWQRTGSPLAASRPGCAALQVAPAAGAEPQMGLQVLCVEPDFASHASLVNLREHVFGSSEAWGVYWCAAPLQLVGCCCCCCCCCWSMLCWMLDGDVMCLWGALLCCPGCLMIPSPQLATVWALAPLISTCLCRLHVQAPASRCSEQQQQRQQQRWRRQKQQQRQCSGAGGVWPRRQGT